LKAHGLRVIVALARFGGIRVPSELDIAWSDVLWDKNRIRITSPKTEHIAQKRNLQVTDEGGANSGAAGHNSLRVKTT
jgi:hypothetical protein